MQATDFDLFTLSRFQVCLHEYLQVVLFIFSLPDIQDWGLRAYGKYRSKIENQLDATYFIIYSILIQCSTCFGR